MPKKEADQKKVEAGLSKEKEKCFAIMPIGDQGDTSAEHFKRVYEDIIVPACDYAGVIADRADKVEGTNLIQLKILKSIIDAPICICDLSCLNPNVMFELGIRQAFDLPVVLIKDNTTRDIFDISGLRYYTYDKSLRYHDVVNFQTKLSDAITATLEQDKKNVSSSIISLLKIDSATFEMNGDADSGEILRLVLSEMNDIKSKVANLSSEIPNSANLQNWGFAEGKKSTNTARKKLDYRKAKDLADKFELAYLVDEPERLKSNELDEFYRLINRYPNDEEFLILMEKVKRRFLLTG